MHCVAGWLSRPDGWRLTVNLNQLKVFCEVLERKGFTRAAESLYLTQPAVSRQIRDLERHFGIELFEQIGKRIRPTEAGETLYSYTQQIFGLLDALETEINQLKGLKAGHLRIVASATAGTYLLPPLLGHFKRQYPGVEVTLEINNSQQVEQRLILHQQLDMGVTERPVAEEALHSEAFDTDELAVIVSPGAQVRPEGKLVPAAELEGAEVHLQGAGLRHPHAAGGGVRAGEPQGAARDGAGEHRGRQAGRRRGPGRVHRVNPVHPAGSGGRAPQVDPLSRSAPDS